MALSNSSPSRTAMIAMPCRPTSPLTRMASPGRTLWGAMFNAVFDDPDAGGVDEQAVAFALVHDLGVAGDDLHAGLSRGLLHRGDDSPQRLHRQAFLDDEAALR